MKTFNDLNPGDYVYIIDLHSGIIDKIQISKKDYSINNTVCFEFYNYDPLWFDRDCRITRDADIKYFSDKDLIDKKLNELIDKYNLIIKTAKQNIQKLKEL